MSSSLRMFEVILVTIVLKVRPQGEVVKKNYLKLFREADAVDVSTAFVNTIKVKRRANWVGQSD